MGVALAKILKAAYCLEIPPTTQTEETTMRLVPSDFLIKGQRLLRLYSYYSLFLALLLIIADSIDRQDILLAGNAPRVFLIVSSLYVIIAAAFVAFASRRPNPHNAISYVFLEIALLSALMFASGGSDSGFSSLILIPLVISNLLAPGVLGFGVAAWSTLALFYTQQYLLADLEAQSIVHSGLQGTLFFTLAAITQSLSSRLQSTLSLADKQATRIRRLQNFSKTALYELPNGVIACDKDHQILLFNQQASRWFELQEGVPLPTLLQQTRPGDVLEHQQLNLLINRVALEQAEPGDYLLYLEDSARISAEAQQIKLASLGRLTASIAHEIRNPLSALRQAAQLLGETDYLQPAEQKLTQIAEQHCMRINRTIEDILQLSRRTQACRETLRLRPWLVHFADHFRNLHAQQTFSLKYRCDESLLIDFDPDHLQQILHNLCSNGLRHALQHRPDNACLYLIAQQKDDKVQLTIADNGGGVSAEQQKHLFEPFYTTEHNGTGLGLYLCRELCEANHATIQYIRSRNQTCFRIQAK